MASKLIILLSLALLNCAYAAPAAKDQPAAEKTTAADEDVPVVEVIEVVQDVPVLAALVNVITTPETETKEPVHKVAKRSALRGDNPSNDLLANYDGFAFDNAAFGVGGRRIKFLPSWGG